LNKKINVICNNIDFLYQWNHAMPDASPESDIAAEVERLRGAFPNTQDLYREVCVLLFFRHGITPTTNRLYQLVRKGSMSAPAEALNRFWKHLRDSSRVSIDAPELPQEFREAAGRLAAAFWQGARETAERSFDVLRSDALAQVDEASIAANAAADLADARKLELERMRAEVAAARAAIATLEQQLDAEHEKIAALSTALSVSRHDNANLAARLDEAYGVHAREMQAAHSAARQAQEHFRAVEQRFLLDLERERTHAAKLHKQLDTEQTGRRGELDKQRAELAGLHAQAGQLRQAVGALEGQLSAAELGRTDAAARLQERHNEIAALTERCVTAEVRVASLRGELERCQQQAAAPAPAHTGERGASTAGRPAGKRSKKA
jgi:Plasmid replication region DNA-binding N-term